jgi:hypothetical protein
MWCLRELVDWLLHWLVSAAYRGTCGQLPPELRVWYDLGIQSVVTLGTSQLYKFSASLDHVTGGMEQQRPKVLYTVSSDGPRCVG